MFRNHTLNACLLAGFLAGASYATTLPLSSVLPGLNPGDQYEFVFVTSGTINGTSSSLSTYNTFVQNAADAASIGSSQGLTWKAMVNVGSSPNNAGTNAAVAQNVKVYLLDGTQVADGATHPFYSLSETQNHLAAISISELGTTTSGLVWTGGNSSGSESGSGLLGSATPVSGDSSGILAARTTGGWARQGNTSSASQLHLYALSGVLTAAAAPTPEPATWGLMGFAVAAFALARRKKGSSAGRPDVS